MYLLFTKFVILDLFMAKPNPNYPSTNPGQKSGTGRGNVPKPKTPPPPKPAPAPKKGK